MEFGDEDLSTIILGSIPKKDDLCCLLGTITLPDKNTSNVSNKAYQCQIFKCRCLIFSVPEVIASPVLGAVQNIHIIISQEYHLSGRLKPHLEKMNIKVEEPIPLTNGVYESCLRYTVLARLAPAWNQVERYLVHSRDFLLTSAPLDAIKLDIVINETDMHIVLWPLRLRLPQVSFQDLNLNSLSSPLSWDLSSTDLTVHVLPSLNKANVLMVTKHIPQNSLFKSYKDLKRHWKNSYGYRLPESEDGMVYLTVKFGRWFSESLTYPMVCVRSQRPLFLRQRQPQQVLMELLGDLHTRLPYVCGSPFGVEATLRYALPKLNVLTQILYPCNLSETKPELKKEEVEEEDDDVVILEDHSQPVSQYTQINRVGTQPYTPKSAQVQSSSPPLFLPRLSQFIPPTPSKPVFVPVFTAKPKSTPTSPAHRWQPSPSPQEQQPTRPMFGGTARPMFGGAHVRPMFGGTSIKSTFGLVQPLPQATKATPTNTRPKHIAPFPIFNSNAAKYEKTSLHLPDCVPSGGGPKKVRNKPQVQQGVDIRALAHTKDGLAKVNTTTLIAYLRSEGVPCKVKDKKGELVVKVLTHLNLPVSSTAANSMSQEFPEASPFLPTKMLE